MRARTARRALALILATPVLLYLLVILMFWAGQRNLLFAGDPTRVAPEAVGLRGFAEVVIPTPDGERLIAWWRPPRPGAGVVLYLHGNGGSLAGRTNRFADLAEADLGVMALSYRGYGGSSGRPSEPALIADAETSLDWIAARAPPERTAVFGESLGSGVAVALAVEREVAGLVLDSPYASVERVAARRFPWLPVTWLASDRFDSEERIARVAEPILAVHCSADTLIEIGEARRLLARAVGPTRLIEVQGCGHVEAWRDPAVRATIIEVLRRLTSGLSLKSKGGEAPMDPASRPG